MQTPSPYKHDSKDPEADIRASWAIGFSRAAEISSVGFQFVLPTLFGVWLDQKYGWPYIGLGIGLLLGGSMAILSLLHLIKKSQEVS